jgi:hypothetical protein
MCRAAQKCAIYSNEAPPPCNEDDTFKVIIFDASRPSASGGLGQCAGDICGFASVKAANKKRND